MAQIEYVGNYLQTYEENEKKKEIEEGDVPQFWDWEMKILGRFSYFTMCRAGKRIRG
jgi:hypothetical protein